MQDQRNQKALKEMHPDLCLAQQWAYGPSGFNATNIQKEEESADYGAFDFDLGSRRCKFRVGKVTPKKAGFFFTIWKRIGAGPIMPYDEADPVDFFVFSVRAPECFGQFIFPKAVLCEKGVLSKAGRGGKRAIRVYPPWVIITNRQARNTQSWQKDYFLEIPRDQPIDSFRVRNLFSQNV